MTEAETIMKMIEEVDPSDNAKLDEIDARTFCLVSNAEFLRMYKASRVRDYVTARFVFKLNGSRAIVPLHVGQKYTRSRDALKAIRPYGYIRIGNDGEGDPGRFKCELMFDAKEPIIISYGETEELAELHAIIQAIQHERENE